MEQITTICYGKKDTWQSREEAQAFFLKAMAGSEGSEQENNMGKRDHQWDAL